MRPTAQRPMMRTKEEEVEILDDDFVYRDDGDNDERATRERTMRRRLQRNHIGTGGNVINDNNCNRGNANNNDPYAKIKFTITSFHGKCDAEEYLDGHMTVEQKFAS